jgi:hypothetical protein
MTLSKYWVRVDGYRLWSSGLSSADLYCLIGVEEAEMVVFKEPSWPIGKHSCTQLHPLDLVNDDVDDDGDTGMTGSLFW